MWLVHEKWFGQGFREMKHEIQRTFGSQNPMMAALAVISAGTDTMPFYKSVSKNIKWIHENHGVHNSNSFRINMKVSGCRLWNFIHVTHPANLQGISVCQHWEEKTCITAKPRAGSTQRSATESRCWAFGKLQVQPWYKLTYQSAGKIPW